MTVEGNVTRFVKGNVSCESYTGLTLAKYIQRNGHYQGSAHVKCQKTRTKTRVVLTIPNQKTVTMYIKVDNPVVESIFKNVTWRSGFNRHHRGRSIVQVANKSTTYTIFHLMTEGFLINGKLSYVEYGESGHQTREPRLCPLMSLATTCSAMKSLSPENVALLGNVTGFNVRLIYPYHDQKFLHLDGTMTGSKGLIEGAFSGAILKKRQSQWIELPLDATTRCNCRWYKFSDCSLLSANEPTPKVTDMKFVGCTSYTF